MQLFISHSSKDRDWVDQVQKRIEAAGAQAYLAEYDRSGVGHVLNDKLKSAIAASNAVVVLLTANAATSPIVREEVGYALGLNKHVIPLVAPEVASNTTALGMLNGLEHIPFDREDYQEGLIQLTDVVNDLVKAELAESHQEERSTLTAQLVERDQALTQLQSRNESIQALLILVGAIAVVAVMSRPSS
jgi:flagellar capping protein FliD